MKKLMISLVVLALLLPAYSCQVARSAKNKTSSEISKKTNKKIEDVFDKDKNEDKAPDVEGNADNTGMNEGDPDKQTEPGVQRTGDFIPGEKTIFLDSLHGELAGEFPSRWDLKNGTAETMTMGDNEVLGFVQSGTTIGPLMDEKAYLPDFFTIEFDVYFHNKGNEGYTLRFDNPKMNLTIRNDGIHYDGYLIRSQTLKSETGWRHVEVSFNKRALKAYLNGERLVNTPNIDKMPTYVHVYALSHNARNNKYAMIDNFRLAEGGVPLYDRLVAEGKFVTNDIHFEYDRAELKSKSMVIIGQVSAMMEEHPEVNLRVGGHTDSDGGEDYNLSLSQKRALAVKEALVSQGIDSSRLSVAGYGESQPIASNETDEGKAMNRRVEFVLEKGN